MAKNKLQIKTFQGQGQAKTIKKYILNNEDTLLISKQTEIVNELVDDRLKEITDLDKKIDSNDLIYRYESGTPDAEFDKFDNVFA